MWVATLQCHCDRLQFSAQCVARCDARWHGVCFAFNYQLYKSSYWLWKNWTLKLWNWPPLTSIHLSTGRWCMLDKCLPREACIKKSVGESKVNKVVHCLIDYLWLVTLLRVLTLMLGHLACIGHVTCKNMLWLSPKGASHLEQSGEDGWLTRNWSNGRCVCVCVCVRACVQVISSAFTNFWSGVWLSKVVYWNLDGLFKCLPIFALSFACQT